MSWGWVGALVGGAAAVLFAPVTGGASLLSIPALIGVGAAGGAGIGMAVGKVTKSFGDTPKNDLAKLGVNPEKLHDEAIKYREKRQQFLDDKNKESKEKIKNMQDKYDALEESIKSLGAEIKNMPDGTEKNAKKALLDKKQNQAKELKKEINDEKGKVDEREKEIDKVFKELSNPVNYTPEQYNNKANTPRWNSYKNWGIGIVGIIILFMLIGFLKKILNSVLSSIKG